MKKQTNDTIEYVVVKTRIETPGVVTLFLTKKDGTTPSFISGQFITVFFKETGTPEGKAYSISSAPHEHELAITVRGIGEFSNRLCAMKEGNHVEASLPYGFFYPENDNGDTIMIAGGIGITPFRSMLRHTAHHSPERKITLFYCVKDEVGAVFLKEFETLKKDLLNLKIHYFMTRQTTPVINTQLRRIDMSDILPSVSDSNQNIMMCGSIPFTRDLWRGLRENNVSDDSIYTEAFFSY